LVVFAFAGALVATVGCGSKAAAPVAVRPSAGTLTYDGAVQRSKGLVRSVAGIPLTGWPWWGDSDVKRHFGAGVFAPDDGHTGGRYFTDRVAT
jgi:hypothetical protein